MKRMIFAAPSPSLVFDADSFMVEETTEEGERVFWSKARKEKSLGGGTDSRLPFQLIRKGRREGKGALCCLTCFVFLSHVHGNWLP